MLPSRWGKFPVRPLPAGDSMIPTYLIAAEADSHPKSAERSASALITARRPADMRGCQERLSFDVARADGSLWRACRSSHSGSSAVDIGSSSRRYGIPRTSPVSAPMCGPSGVSSPWGWVPQPLDAPSRSRCRAGQAWPGTRYGSTASCLRHFAGLCGDNLPGGIVSAVEHHAKPPSDRGDRATQRVACPPRLRAIDAGVQRVLPSWHLPGPRPSSRFLVRSRLPP